jgi:hypothetical protein
MNRIEALLIAIIFTFALIVSGLTIRQSMSCYSSGGIVVRGLASLECIR